MPGETVSGLSRRLPAGAYWPWGAARGSPTKCSFRFLLLCRRVWSLLAWASPECVSEMKSPLSSRPSGRAWTRRRRQAPQRKLNLSTSTTATTATNNNQHTTHDTRHTAQGSCIPDCDRKDATFVCYKSHSFSPHMAGGASEPQSRSSERASHGASDDPVKLLAVQRSWYPALASKYLKVLLLSEFMLAALMPFRTREARKFAELWALLAKQEDEEQMIKEAEPMQSRQEQLPDVCRAVDKNESKGEIETAATTSAVEDDRTTLVAEAANIPASELVHQNNPEYTGRGTPNRGGGVRLAGRPWRQVNKQWSMWNWTWLEPGRGTSKGHALSQKILFRRGVKLMAAWRKLSLNSAATRERDKKTAHSFGWNSEAGEYMDCEACESDEDFMSALENEYSDEASETDQWMR